MVRENKRRSYCSPSCCTYSKMAAFVDTVTVCCKTLGICPEHLPYLFFQMMIALCLFMSTQGFYNLHIVNFSKRIKDCSYDISPCSTHAVPYIHCNFSWQNITNLHIIYAWFLKDDEVFVNNWYKVLPAVSTTIRHTIMLHFYDVLKDFSRKSKGEHHIMIFPIPSNIAA